LLKKEGGEKMNGKVVLFAITLISASLICGVGFFAIIATSSTSYVYPDDFPGQTLQEAIWNETVENGDTIYVKQDPDPYYVHLDVNKSITLEGFDRFTTTLDGSGNGTVITVNADNVEISEFTIQNGEPYGVYINNGNNCNVSRNIVKNNFQGIELASSVYCMLRDNDIKFNTYNFGVSGGGIHDIDVSNEVDGKPIYYWVDRQNETIPLDAGYVALVNCENITVENLLLRNNAQGIVVSGSTNITLRNLDIRYNDVGVLFIATYNSRIEEVSVITPSYQDSLSCYAIQLMVSDNNLICNNIVLHDGYFGIELGDSQNNTINDNVIQDTYIHHGYGMVIIGDNNTVYGNNILNNWYSIWLQGNGSIFYHNNFINNPMGVLVWPTDSANSWNSTLEGNYWDDIHGVDSDCDGINDPPCRKQLTNYNIDYHTLNQTWTPIRKIDASWLLRNCRDSFPELIPNYAITLQSDHVLACYNFTLKWEDQLGLVTLNVTASSPGFCNVTIPRIIVDMPFELFVNNEKITDPDFTYNVTHCSIYFTYSQGIHQVKIIGYRVGSVYGDVNHDGVVNMRDIAIVCSNFQEKP